jgi:excisionase family DNA binding protein
MPANHTPIEPLVVDPQAAQRMLACGRTHLYELLAAGELDSFKDGRSRKITVASIKAFVARQLAAAKSEERK